MLYSILRLKNDTAWQLGLAPKHWPYQLLVSSHESTSSLLTIQPHGTKVESRPVPSGGIRTLIDQDGTCKISSRGDTGCFGEKKTKKTPSARQSGLAISDAPSRLFLEQHAGAGSPASFLTFILVSAPTIRQQPKLMISCLKSIPIGFSRCMELWPSVGIST